MKERMKHITMQQQYYVFSIEHKERKNIQNLHKNES